MSERVKMVYYAKRYISALIYFTYLLTYLIDMCTLVKFKCDIKQWSHVK